MQADLKHLGLLFAGFALGFGGVTISRDGIAIPSTLSTHIDQAEHGNALASLACLPQEENDDIFFVTCGGIY
jgi:hypothetical protein